MRYLVLGATGMVGQAVMARGRAREHVMIGAGRSGPDLTADVQDLAALESAIGDARPDVIVNTVAIVDLGGCEARPELAYAVNARPTGLLAELCGGAGIRLVHVSTDHYFTGDGAAKHDEQAPVRLLNEYARTKFAAEAFALSRPDALVLRTNVTGFRHRAGAPTFVEWAIGAITAGERLTLFDDFHTSTMASSAFADALFDLVDAGAAGLINVASSQVASKREFLSALSDALGHPLNDPASGSVRGLKPARAESLGLDVALAERLLGRPLPDLGETVRALVAEQTAALEVQPT